MSTFPGYNKITRPHGTAQWHILWNEEETACGRRVKLSHEVDVCDDTTWQTGANKCLKCHEWWLRRSVRP